MGAPTTDLPNPDDQFCPICKTTRYLRKDLSFLINPECYHPMCTVCVARIFADGPAQCPHASCHKTLRRVKFRAPRFADLAVEREVDIRRRVAAVFIKTESDFETLADYNAYLDTVESLTMDLVYGADAARARAERELAEWEAAHRLEIERRRKQGREQDALRRRTAAAELEVQRQRRLDALREDEEDRRRDARLREEMLDGLASAESGADAANKVVNRVLLKRRVAPSQQQRSAEETAAAVLGANGGTPSLVIKGLREPRTRPRRGGDDDGPYDAFGGIDLAPTRYRLAPSEEYHSRWVDDARSEPKWRTGGYSVDEYLGRAMHETFAGLGVFVADEKGGEVF